MSKYWDINLILPYQRCFNLINGERSIGKTYTTQKFYLDRAINKGQEFVYIVRTQDEKKQGIFEAAHAKVIQNEFPNTSIKFETDICYIEDSKETLGYCIALSECIKIKKRSFPNVKWLIFDEYMLEEKQSQSYVNGWKEPDLFLSIYHTIDREQDKVICFLLGNNTSFYNPYHLHPAFNVPNIPRGQLWYSENVLFFFFFGSDELKEEKEKSKFVKMIKQTQYGKYAVTGDYVDDNINFIAKRDSSAQHYFNISYNDITYGIWLSRQTGCIYVSNKYDPYCKLNYALSVNDHSENTLLTRDKSNTMLQWLAKNFKLGNVRFENMEIKKKTEQAILMLL